MKRVLSLNVFGKDEPSYSLKLRTWAELSTEMTRMQDHMNTVLGRDGLKKGDEKPSDM